MDGVITYTVEQLFAIVERDGKGRFTKKGRDYRSLHKYHCRPQAFMPKSRDKDRR